MPRELRKEESVIKCKPFVKWAGGKSQLLPELRKRMPESFGSYFEPFLGGGAFFLATQPERAFLSDINYALIECYEVVRDEPEKLISTLKTHKYEKDYFYSIRDKDRSSHFSQWSRVRRAARLIYLNKTCFNGLYRVNSKGQFNVPFGRYSSPLICDEDNIRACSSVLQSASFSTGHFSFVLEKAKKEDFVYFDPPYTPLDRTSNFTSYAKDGFGDEDQEQLRDVCVALDKKGVKFLLSNSSAQLILDLYKDFNLDFVKASRAINSKASKRGKINEVLVTNYDYGK